MFIGFIVGAVAAGMVGWFVATIWAIKQVHKLNEVTTWHNEQNDTLWRHMSQREEEIRRTIDTRCDMIERNVDDLCSDKRKCDGNCGRPNAD